jgi:hypothetical protein
MSSLNRGGGRLIEDAAQSMEMAEPNARFRAACEYTRTMRKKVIYLDSPMRPMVFQPNHPGPWAGYLIGPYRDQLKSYIFDVEDQIALYESMRDGPRKREFDWRDGNRQIYPLREFLDRCNRDLAAFTFGDIDYDSLPAEWDCVWNDQMMTWVACDHGKPIGEMSLAAYALREHRVLNASSGEGVDVVPEPATTNVIGLIAALRRSIAEDDPAKAEVAAAEKTRSAKPMASKSRR